MTIQNPIAWQANHIATMDPQRTLSYGAIHDAVIVTRGELIEWVGERDALPGTIKGTIAADDWHTLPEGYWITPGLVDCHTHIVYGGNRSGEFEQRLTGVTYAEIARQGGGIVSTVRATRAASHDQLVASATPRLERLLEEGVTTLEIKSGYGLDIETELTMLRAARELATSLDVGVVTTHLGAHTLPPEYADRADDYIDHICVPSIQAAADEGLADAVDAFCESIGFDIEQTRRVFDAAAQANLPIKLHSEQLSNLGGTRLACEYKALSVDHLEYLDQPGIEAMAKSGTVAVLLPGAFYFLRETRLPPMELLREFNIPMAIASDCNPGSSPVTSLLLMLNMGCTLFALTPEEALAGVTRNAARALGLEDRGMIRAGLRADLSAWDVDQPADLAYGIGHNPCRGTLREGRVPVRTTTVASLRTQAFSS